MFRRLLLASFGCLVAASVPLRVHGTWAANVRETASSRIDDVVYTGGTFHQWTGPGCLCCSFAPPTLADRARALAWRVRSWCRPLERLDDGRHSRTMSAMRTIATACERYALARDHYPLVVSLAELRPFLEPTYVKRLPEKDGWGHDIAIESSGHDYTIRSRGTDQRWQRADRPEASGRNEPLTQRQLLELWLRP